MTNGEKLKEIFPYLENDDTDLVKVLNIDNLKSWWNAEYKESTNTIDYRRAFKIACDLLNGDVLYGVDTDKIFELMMQKDGVVSSSSYEEYILNHLQELDQGQYASESVTPTGSTTKNNLAVDWDELKRKIFMEVDGGTDDRLLRYGDVCDRISNSIDEFIANMRGEEE